jgi:hypothetical protein
MISPGPVVTSSTLWKPLSRALGYASFRLGGALSARLKVFDCMAMYVTLYSNLCYNIYQYYTKQPRGGI